MIKHTLILLWKQKQRNLLIWVELFLVFIVMFVVIYNSVDEISKYLMPTQFKSDNIVCFFVSASNLTDEEQKKDLLNFKTYVKQLENVENITAVWNGVPFESSWSSWTIYSNHKSSNAIIREADLNYKDVTGFEIIKGRWFTENDFSSYQKPVLISKDLAELFYGDEDPIGKLISSEKDPSETDAPMMKVIGITSVIKNHDFDEYEPNIFKLRSLKNSDWMPSRFLIKIKEGEMHQFLKNFNSQYKKILDPGHWSVWKLSTLDSMREYYKSEKKSDFFNISVITFVVLLNAFLGLIGVLWYNINLRKKEIGLRKAVGSSSFNVKKQLLYESLILSAFAIIPGLLLLIQIPILGFYPVKTDVFIITMLIDILLFIVLIIFCTLYPANIASRVRPAVALHHD